jgi:hypothetical protein
VKPTSLQTAKNPDTQNLDLTKLAELSQTNEPLSLACDMLGTSLQTIGTYFPLRNVQTLENEAIIGETSVVDVETKATRDLFCGAIDEALYHLAPARLIAPYDAAVPDAVNVWEWNRPDQDFGVMFWPNTQNLTIGPGGVATTGVYSVDNDTSGMTITNTEGSDTFFAIGTELTPPIGTDADDDTLIGVITTRYEDDEGVMSYDSTETPKSQLYDWWVPLTLTAQVNWAVLDGSTQIQFLMGFAWTNDDLSVERHVVTMICNEDLGTISSTNHTFELTAGLNGITRTFEIPLGRQVWCSMLITSDNTAADAVGAGAVGFNIYYSAGQPVGYFKQGSTVPSSMVTYRTTAGGVIQTINASDNYLQYYGSVYPEDNDDPNCSLISMWEGVTAISDWGNLINSFILLLQAYCDSKGIDIDSKYSEITADPGTRIASFVPVQQWLNSETSVFKDLSNANKITMLRYLLLDLTSYQSAVLMSDDYGEFFDDAISLTGN